MIILILQNLIRKLVTKLKDHLSANFIKKILK